MIELAHIDEPAPGLDDAPDAAVDTAAEDPAGGGATALETIVTTLGGAAIGGAAIWLLAPVCFAC